MKKKIFLTVLLVLLVGLSVYFLVREISLMPYYLEQLNLAKNANDEVFISIFANGILYSSIHIFYILLNLLIFIFVFLYVWGLYYYLKISIQDYKLNCELKKEKKIQQRKKIIQKRIDKLNEEIKTLD